MPHRALIKHRPWLLFSLFTGVTYFFVSDDPIGGAWLMVWKGAGVACLAVYAALRCKGTDGALLALAMALAAAGDIALELNMVAGGGIFAASHLVAIGLYLRNPRSKVATSQMLAGAMLLCLTPVIGALMLYPLPNWGVATIYSLIVGAMAAAAWTSRFPRYRVGIGAVMFVVSDLLIFAGEGGILPDTITGWLIWPLYYGGQFLIAVGVVRTLRRGNA